MCKHLETRVVSCNGKTCVRSNFFCFSFVDLKYWYQLFFHSFLCRQNMVEAKHEQHPDFFKHRKNFRYVVLEKEPKIGHDIPSGPNYAFGVHSSTSDYLCGFEKQPHYHVFLSAIPIIEKVPCLYSTFCLLLADCSSLSCKVRL